MSPPVSPSHGAVCLRIKEGKSYEVVSGNSNTLDEFQTRQKMMEEQNNRKKELLAKAIADRFVSILLSYSKSKAIRVKCLF